MAITQFLSRKVLIPVSGLILASLTFTLLNFESSAKAVVLPSSATSPVITKVENFPDTNTVKIHWTTPQSDSGSPITDYAYLIQGGYFTSANFVSMNQAYTLSGNDFTFTISGLVRCECIQYTIQIASMRRGQIFDPSRQVGVWFPEQDPQLVLSSTTALNGGFTFSANDWVDPKLYPALSQYNLALGASGLPIGPAIGDTIYGPFIFKVSAIYGSDIATVKVDGPDSSGLFTVSGVPTGARVGVTVVKRPITCSNLTITTYCPEATAATVYGVAG